MNSCPRRRSMTLKRTSRKPDVSLICMVAACALTAAAAVTLYVQPTSGLARKTAPPSRQQVVAAYSALPLAFEPNQGQSDPQVRYLARGNSYALFLTANEAVLAMNAPSALRAARAASPQAPAGTVVRMRMVGANANVMLSSTERLPGHSNYYLGNDPRK